MLQLFRCCCRHVCTFCARFCPPGVRKCRVYCMCSSPVRNCQQKVPCSISSDSNTGIEDCLHLCATFCKKPEVQKRTTNCPQGRNRRLFVCNELFFRLLAPWRIYLQAAFRCVSGFCCSIQSTVALATSASCQQVVCFSIDACYNCSLFAQL